MAEKLINEPFDVVKESLEGYLLYHPDVKKVAKADAIIRCSSQDKVSVISGGGSGHEPMLTGLIGYGMLDGVCIGNVFTSPDAISILRTMEAVNSDSGILCLIWNYAGDTMNFELARSMAEDKGIQVEVVIVHDDIASSDEAFTRRGVAGMLFVAKIAGAAAERGDSLMQVSRIAQKAAHVTRTIGIALSSCALPGCEANFKMMEHEFEYGMGIHGEAGRARMTMMRADDITGMMFEDLMNEGIFTEGSQILVLLNGMVSTTQLELNIVYRSLHQRIHSRNLRIHDARIGHYCTSLEMAGISITFLLLDEELKQLYEHRANSPVFHHVLKGCSI